ncbi:HEPN domain-containing protein [Thermus neutrinimicus]|uniref:HEPN domain-containing protein n=1 Tax=Thermus neutrinimicus TaxID=2908149 RepID=UPI001FA99D13
MVWEDPCFDVQQAAEKALNALLIALGVPFPKSHDTASSADPSPPPGAPRARNPGAA